MLCVHPQGWIYFYNRSLKVVTDHDIRDDAVYSSVSNSTSGYPLSDLDDQMEVLFMQLDVESKPQNSTFNLVINHKHCIASYVYEEVQDKNFHSFDPNTLNRKRRLYWNYLWKHPAHVPTPERAVPDAADALTWYYTDNLISGSRSVVPFSKPECEDLSRVVQEMAQPWNHESVARTVFLAWLLREACSFRDSECYGQFTWKTSEAVRKSKVLPPNSASRRPSWLISTLNLIMNILFFGIPHTYYTHVKRSSEYRGRLASVKQNWETYIERLVREYSHFLLISTVLLSATVGFMAVPVIAAPARVAATISAFASMGSLIVGVFSIWRHQSNAGTADSFTYMYNVQHSYLGLHGHAMLLSLPPVLLVWAIVAFAVSIVAFTVQDLTDADVVHRASGWTVVGVFAILLAAITTALYTFSVIWKFQRKSWRFKHYFTKLLPQTENNVGP